MELLQQVVEAVTPQDYNNSVILHPIISSLQDNKTNIHKTTEEQLNALAQQLSPPILLVLIREDAKLIQMIKLTRKRLSMKRIYLNET